MATVVERLTSSRFENGQQQTLPPVYKVPEFNHPYKVHPCHPLTAQYDEEAHKWLASFDVDADLGTDMWRDFVGQETASLTGDVYADFDLEPRTWLWLMRICCWIFALDSKMDDTECGMNTDKSCGVLLDHFLVLLWNYPDNKQFLDYVKALSKSITSDHAKGLVAKFEENLVHARNLTKSIMDIQLVPLAAALRELWIEYCEAVPSGLELRVAIGLCNYLAGITWEAKNRKANLEYIKIEEYIPYRRMTVALTPFLACCDLFIARRKDPISHIPDHIYFSSEMQGLLDADSDLVCWHNDIISFYKECLVGEHTHNLVKLVAREHNCASYTEAGEMICKHMYDRIEEMELLYEQIRAAAAPEFHPAIDFTMKACRDWVSGTHKWHLRSRRYLQACSKAEQVTQSF